MSTLLGGDLQAAAGIFFPLDGTIPDFFEIKNNPETTHLFPRKIGTCNKALRSIEGAPHYNKLSHSTTGLDHSFSEDPRGEQ